MPIIQPATRTCISRDVLPLQLIAFFAPTLRFFLFFGPADCVALPRDAQRVWRSAEEHASGKEQAGWTPRARTPAETGTEAREKRSSKDEKEEKQDKKTRRSTRKGGAFRGEGKPASGPLE